MEERNRSGFCHHECNVEPHDIVHRCAWLGDDLAGLSEIARAV